MEHIIRRCKHCNKEYTYCTYGNGTNWGTEESCSMDFCGECQKVINDALLKIPQKFSYKMELIPDKDFDYINKCINSEKEKYIKEITDRVRFATASFYPGDEYKDVEGCYINYIYYIRGIKENGDVEIKQSMEYDLISQKLTGKRYRFYDKPFIQYKPLCSYYNFKSALTCEKNIETSTRNIIFEIPEWTVLIDNKKD